LKRCLRGGGKESRGLCLGKEKAKEEGNRRLSASMRINRLTEALIVCSALREEGKGLEKEGTGYWEGVR